MSGRGRTPNDRQARDNIFRELVTKIDRFILPNEIKLDQIIGFGGFAEVYDADMCIAETDETKRVAVKRFRVVLSTAEEFAKSFTREILIWKQLEHENILPLLGVTVIEGIPCTVSEWMENGTMDAYLIAHADADVFELVKGVACGLEYLHSRNVVHSDLKSDNVLISHDGRPVLADFGISRLLIESVTIAGTTTLRGNARWMAPELIVAPIGSPNQMHTKATDVWAFGMIVYVAIDKRAPFHECNNEIQVMTSITSGKLPTKPDGAANGAGNLELLWDCCRACWNRDPVDRPTMAEARERLCAGSTVSDGPAHGWHIVQPKKAPGVERISKVPACSNCWLSPTGQYLAIRSEDQKTISFWETRTMSRCGPDCETEPDVFQLAWSPTEKHIVTSSKDGVHRKWGDIFESPKLVAQSTQKHENAKIEYSPDDRLIASFDRTAKLWDASNLSLVWQYSGYMSFSVAFHPLGRRVVFFDSAYLAIDVNAEDHGDITATERNLGLLVSRPVFDPSGNTCAVGTPEDVLILSADSFEETDLLPYRYVDAMRFTPDSKHILLVLESKMLVLWDIAASAVVQQFTIDIPEFYVWSAHISNDCRVVRVSDSKYTSHIIHLTY